MSKILILGDIHGRGFGKNRVIIGKIKLYFQEIIMTLMGNMQMTNPIKQSL